MNKYLDYKATIWGRMFFKDVADINKVVEKLEQGYLPAELAEEDLGFDYWEIIDDTEEFITPSENDGQSTIEVYEGDNFQECIWDNSYESEIKRKQK